MKNISCILIAASVLMACRHSNKEIIQRISVSDSLAINYFKGDGTMDTVVAVKIIRDKQTVNRLADLIGEQIVERNYKCGYDGSLHFFRMNQVIQDIDFRMNEAGCMYFTFLQKGKQQATRLSEEAKALITSLKNSRK